MISSLSNTKAFSKTEQSKNVQSVPKRACHTGAVQVVDGLYASSFRDSLDLVDKVNVDIIVPLDSANDDIWLNGWRGEVWYYPTRDYGVLPIDLAKELVGRVIDALAQGKKVGVFCIGGHGRTGYVLSMILGKLGYAQPITYLRKHYCVNAVEAESQVRQIATVLDIAERDLYETEDEYLEDTRYFSKPKSYGGYGYSYGGYLDKAYEYANWGSTTGYPDPVTDMYKKDIETTEFDKILYAMDSDKPKEHCGLCMYYDPMMGACDLTGEGVGYMDTACEAYEFVYDFGEDNKDKDDKDEDDGLEPCCV